MSTPLVSRLLRSAAASILLMTAFSPCASAGGKNSQIHGNGFSPTVLKVISENGTSWTRIEESAIALPVTVEIGMSDYVISGYEIRQLGQTGAGQHLAFGIPDKHHDDQVNFSTTYYGSTDYLSDAERQTIIAGCNAKLGEGKGIRESHNVFGGVGVELTTWFTEAGISANINEGSEGNANTHKSTASVIVPVKCEGKHQPADDVAAKEPNFGVKGIHLRFATSAGYPTRPNLATRCQMTEARVRLETSKAGAVKFKLWTKVGSQPMQSQVVDAWSNFVGPGKFEAAFHKAFVIDKSTVIQAMAEDLTNPIGQSTGWKEVNVDCTGAGGGGLTGSPGTPGQPQASQHAPMPLHPGFGIGTKVAPLPPRTAPPLPPRFGQLNLPRAPVAVAAKDRFYPSKIRPY